MGSFAGAKWDMLPFIAVVVLVSIIFSGLKAEF
ncbi:MAG: hypothetical protein ACLRZ2_01125 [Veillonella sp.]